MFCAISCKFIVILYYREINYWSLHYTTSIPDKENAKSYSIYLAHKQNRRKKALKITVRGWHDLRTSLISSLALFNWSGSKANATVLNCPLETRTSALRWKIANAINAIEAEKKEKSSNLTVLRDWFEWKRSRRRSKTWS